MQQFLAWAFVDQRDVPAEVQDDKIDIKGNAIVVYTADQDIETLADVFTDRYPGPSANTQLRT
jgi:hypothetical protein